LADVEGEDLTLKEGGAEFMKSGIEVDDAELDLDEALPGERTHAPQK